MPRAALVSQMKTYATRTGSGWFMRQARKSQEEPPQTETMTDNKLAVQKAPGALSVMSQRYSVDPTKLLQTLKSTVFAGASDDELMALVVVSNEYGLNPFLKEIYAFPKKGGGIQPLISVDGWVRMMNSNPAFDGIEFEFSNDEGDTACTATIHIKGRSKPVRVTEYKSECERNTDPWKTCPRRMLRHKALIQACRVAFGFSGAFEEHSPEAIEVFAEPVATHQPTTQRAEIAEVAQDTKPTTPQHDLQSIVMDAGFTFRDFHAWAIESKQFKDADSVGTFSEVPTDIATRMVRAKAGLIQQLTARKGGVA